MSPRYLKHDAPPVCQGLPQPNLRQTRNEIVILLERLSWLRQDNFVSLARRPLWGAQAAERKKPLVCKEALRQAPEENAEGFRGVPQNFTVA